MGFISKEMAVGPAARLLTESEPMGRTLEAARERGPRQMTVGLESKETRPGLHGPRADITR